MEQSRHLRHLHYRDERAHHLLQHLVNPWARKGGEGGRRQGYRIGTQEASSSGKLPRRGKLERGGGQMD